MNVPTTAMNPNSRVNNGNTPAFRSITSPMAPNTAGVMASSNAVRQANCASEGLAPNFLATSGIRVFSEGGAAAGLEAETSDNLTYGVILQPELGDAGDLSVAIDYFDIQINNGVDQAGGTNILTRCYDDPQFPTDGGFCRLVSRNPAVSQQLTVSNAHTNIATQIAEGIDYTIRYERDLGPGSIRVNALATHYLTQADKPNDEPQQLTEVAHQLGGG